MRKNLTVLTITAFLSGIYQSMVQVVWQPYALSLGASISTLGLLNSLGGYGGLVTSLVQPVGGWLSDQTGHKKFVVWSSVVASVALGFYFIAGRAGRWELLMPAVILMGASALARPARTALVAESSDETRRGTAYSLVFLASVLPGIFAPVLGGYIAEQTGRPTVFFVGLLLELVALAVIVRWLSESHVLVLEPITLGQVIGVFRRAVLPPPHLRAFFLCIAGDSFVWGVGLGVLFGVLSRDYGFSDAQLGMLNSASSLTMALSQLPLGWVIDRYGAKPLIVLSEALGIPLMLMWLTHKEVSWFVASFALFGLVGATWMPAVMTYLMANTSPGSRSEAIGQLSAFRGLIAFPAPALGGLLYEWGGLRAPVLFNLIGIIILMFALALFVRGQTPTDLESQPVFRISQAGVSIPADEQRWHKLRNPGSGCD